VLLTNFNRNLFQRSALVSLGFLGLLCEQSINSWLSKS